MPFVPLTADAGEDKPAVAAKAGFTPVATPNETTNPVIDKAKYSAGILPGLVETGISGAAGFANTIESGLTGGVYAGLGTLEGKPFKEEFYKGVNKEQAAYDAYIAPILEPQTRAGKDINKGFSTLAEKIRSLGEKVTDITGSEWAGALTESGLQTVGIPLGLKAAVSVVPFAGSTVAAAMARAKKGAEAPAVDNVAGQLKSIRPEVPVTPQPTAGGEGFTPETTAAPAPVSPEPVPFTPEGKVAGGPTPEESAQMTKDAEAWRAMNKPTFTPKPGDEPTTPRHEVPGLSVQEVPLGNLKLSEDVPQFKKEANAQGIVTPLGGKFDRVGAAPIQIWQRLNGDMEIISGRHRFDLAKRSGEETIPAQIHREADGFTIDHAQVLDAELNIRDEQGGVNDYANYFKTTGLDEETAKSRGLLARAKGRAGYTIANQASDDVFAAHGAGVISDEAALAIARAAPKDAAAQSVGLKLINDGKSVSQAENTIRAIALMQKNGEVKPEQGDIFGFDDSAIRQAEEMAKRASAAQRAIKEQLAAVSGATKRPEIARKLGVDVKDPEAVKAKIEQLRAAVGRLANWPLYPDLVREFRGEEERPTVELQGETEAEIRAKEDTAKKAKAEEEATVKAEQESKDKADVEAKKKAYAENPDNFQFGESSKDAVKPEGDLFAAKPSERRNPEERTALYGLAKALAEKEGKIGISLLRRHYPQFDDMKAARVLDQLEKDGVVGPVSLRTGGRELLKPEGETSEQATKETAQAKPREEKQSKEPAELSIGRTPNAADSVTVREGKIYIGEYPATDFETGDDVAIADDATPQQIKDALDKAGVLGKGQKMFGLKPHVEKEPSIPEAKPVSDTVKRIMAERERAKGAPKAEQDRATYGEPAPTFFSQLSKSIADAPDKVFGKAENVSNWINANASKLGVKKAEIEATGLDDWLKLQGKVTKADVQNFLDQNGVQVKDVTLGEPALTDAEEKKFKELNALNNAGKLSKKQFREEYLPLRQRRDAEDTKFASYQLPGGENYRELLLTLPEKRPPIDYSQYETSKDTFGDWQVTKDGRYVGNPVRAASHEDAINKAVAKQLQEKPAGFRSSHYDQPNILAHIRFNERTDAEGKRVLFLEELQSDFGQAFKKQKDAIGKAVDNDFQGIIERMKKAGVLEVNCD